MWEAAVLTPSGQWLYLEGPFHNRQSARKAALAKAEEIGGSKFRTEDNRSSDMFTEEV